MKVKFNISKKERKDLALVIGGILKKEVKYLGVPSCSYQIGKFELTKNGTLVFSESLFDKLEEMKEDLLNNGFSYEVVNTDEKEKNGVVPKKQKNEETTFDVLDTGEFENSTVIGDFTDLNVEFPISKFTDEDIERVKSYVATKGKLIKMALGINELPIVKNDDKLSFPWFKEIPINECMTYTKFIQKLCKLSTSQKRVTCKEKDIVNPKYEFRCFLLRLGFIGKEYKKDRAILLSKLEGSSSFLHGKEGK